MLASMMSFSMAPAIAFADENDESAKAGATENAEKQTAEKPEAQKTEKSEAKAEEKAEVKAAAEPEVKEAAEPDKIETGSGEQRPSDENQEEQQPGDVDEDTQEPAGGRNGDKYEIVSEEGEDGKISSKVVEKEESQKNPDIEKGKVVTPYAEQSSDVKTTPNADGSDVTDADKWDTFYDAEKGVFHLTYTIDEQADAEYLTLDLTYALRLLKEFALEQKTAANVIEPGDTIVFEFNIKSNSSTKYEYLPGSFVLQTPDLANYPGDLSGIKSYDGQTLPDVYTDTKKYNVGLKTVPVKELLLESGIVKDEYKDKFESLINQAWMYDFNGSWGINNELYGYNRDYRTDEFKAYNGDAEKYLMDYINKKYGTSYTDLGSALEYYFCQYYSEKEGADYQSFADLMASNNAVKELFSSTASNKPVSIGGKRYDIQLPANTKYDNYFKNLISFVYGDDISDKTGDYNGQYTNRVRVYDGVVDADDGKVYDGCIPACEIGPSATMYTEYYGLPDDTLFWIDSESGRMVFGFGDGNGGVRTATNCGEPTSTKLSSFNMYKNDSWSTDNYNRTVGDYMTEGSDAWNEVEAFFKEKFEGGIGKVTDVVTDSLEGAASAGQTIISFLMGLNLDGELTGNNYQNTFWGWYNAITLVKSPEPTVPEGGDNPPPEPPAPPETPNEPNGDEDVPPEEPKEKEPEKETEKPKTESHVELDDSVKTGDDYNLGAILALMGLSLGGAAFATRRRDEVEE